MDKSKSVKKVAIISPYVPKQCGIATYAENLYNSLCKCRNLHVEIGAVDNGALDYNSEVKNIIEFGNAKSFEDYARYINKSDIDLVAIQHEFGIFGGTDGSFIQNFVEELKKPYVITFHTVLLKPNKNQYNFTKFLSNHANRVIVMAESALKRLALNYSIPSKKISVIPHGVPMMDYVSDNSYFKNYFGLKNRSVLTTFGLLSRNKGIEYVIKAMPKIIGKHPEAIFLVIGKTHPNILRYEGEEYRDHLRKLVKDNGLQNNVRFENQYLSASEIINFFMATDIYITPYLEPQQITSGTLAYALGAGKPIISTPYSYAKEFIGRDNGFLVPFRSSVGIAKPVNMLLKNREQMSHIAKNNYNFSRYMVWDQVGLSHNKLFSEIIESNKIANLSYHTKIENKVVQSL